MFDTHTGPNKPDVLPETPEQFLRAVADLIEQDHTWWDQANFSVYGDTILTTVEWGHTCGTAVCVAGWTIRLASKEIFDRAVAASGHNADWGCTPAALLGLSPHLAEALFYTVVEPTEDNAAIMAAALRVIADLPEGERTVERLAAAAGAEVYALLHLDDWLSDPPEDDNA